MRLKCSCAVVAICIATSANAGDEILYEPSPEWVEPIAVDPDADKGSAIRLFDSQTRLEKGRRWSYTETIFALDTPEALTQFGTVAASWLPDKGDLRIHAVELKRGSETIDLLANGEEFEILRRERGLESRLLDGVLTATMPVSGAQLGDELRLAYSVTLSDQAMGDETQWQQVLPSKPFPLADGNVTVSWPEDLDVTYLTAGEAELGEPALRDGFYYWNADLPLPESDEWPQDAPRRYQLGELVQIGTYSDWQAVSSNMAPHYDVTDTIKPGSDLAQEVAFIAADYDDPLRRAAMALQIVQDDVSYLLNGLDGGNYLPQSPEETWEKRFGDCKAKSVLLLAMLRKLGVDAEVVLVRTDGGDALPKLAPMPGNFDHMIVRAQIDGTTYWLDGTTAGTRLDTIDRIPRFHYALPLREEGADLLPMDQRPQSMPDQIVRITMDHSAGVRLPALIDVEMEFRGVSAAQWRALSDQSDSEQQEDSVYSRVMGVVGGALLSEHSVEYSVKTGVATVKATGVQNTLWRQDRAVYEFDAPAQAARNVGFETDRARAAWRDIPLRLNGPVYYSSEFDLLLPDETDGFEMEGTADTREVIGGVELGSKASLNSNRFSVKQTMRSVLDELPAAEISPARRSLARFGRSLPTLKSPRDIRQLWEYFGKDRAKLEPIEAAYAKAIAKADPDDTNALSSRARFRSSVFDFKGALEDIEAALAIEASSELYAYRFKSKYSLGDLEGALEDLRLTEELEPNGWTYDDQVEILALLGRTDEALALAEEYRGLGESVKDEDMMMARALGWAGRVDEALELLDAQLEMRPGDGTLLNSICWQAGIWNVMNAERMEQCVSAVEKSDYSSSALDSRALAHFRMGNPDAAIADLNAALLLEPGLAYSRLLRGIVRVANGDKSGQEDIDVALKMEPEAELRYKAWGLTL